MDIFPYELPSFFPLVASDAIMDYPDVFSQSSINGHFNGVFIVTNTLLGEGMCFRGLDLFCVLSVVLQKKSVGIRKTLLHIHF